MLDSGYWSRENEELVDKVELCATISALDGGYSVVIDATNVGKKRITRFDSIIKMWYPRTVDLVLKWFDTSLATCQERNALRQGRAKVPISTLDSMYAQFQTQKLRYRADNIEYC